MKKTLPKFQLGCKLYKAVGYQHANEEWNGKLKKKSSHVISYRLTPRVNHSLLNFIIWLRKAHPLTLFFNLQCFKDQKDLGKVLL